MTHLLRRAVTAGAGLTAAALAATTLLASSADAAAPTTTNHIQAAAAWLSTQFEGTKHLPEPTGYKFTNKYGSTYYINYGEDADAVFGLAAAKAGGAKITRALDYLAYSASDYAASGGDGALGKMAVAAEVGGVPATSFGGINLLARLKSDECTATSSSCPAAGSASGIYSSVSESYVLIAEARAGGQYAPSAAAKNYFASLQCDSGGFTGQTASCGSGAADIDATSYAIMAMTAMKITGTALTKAISWLQGQQNADGSWTYLGAQNTGSTGLASAALQGAGAGHGTARSWLVSQQRGSGRAGVGAISYAGQVAATTASSTSPAVSATAQALPGLVDGGSLATLTAHGSVSGVRYYRATASAPYTQHPGSRVTVTGTGFAAGEKVRITRGTNSLGTATVGPLGQLGKTFTLSRYAQPGYSSYTLTGVSSGLVAAHHVHIVT